MREGVVCLCPFCGYDLAQKQVFMRLHHIGHQHHHRHRVSRSVCDLTVTLQFVAHVCKTFAVYERIIFARCSRNRNLVVLHRIYYSTTTVLYIYSHAFILAEQVYETLHTLLHSRPHNIATNTFLLLSTARCV